MSDNDPFKTGGGLKNLEDVLATAEDPLVRRTLGAYEIISMIAAGGMGRVYRARRADGSLDREVALKVSATSSLSDELRSRFAQEQNVLAGLNHPNICQLYDAQVSDEGWPYIVMELIDGDSIVEYCHKNELSVEDRLHLLTHVVDAVAYAHSQLVVHRDIKPANVLVNSNEEVKLLDFGIAKLLEPDAKLTQGAPLTPRYASPEQLLGQPITVASDIAQLGLLIYEVLSGEPLNPSETLAGAIQRAADGRSLRVELDKARELPREVLPVIEHCLRADPSDRYSDANSLKADLEAYLNGYPVAAVGQSTGYRFRKLISRNWPTAITAMVAIAAIVSGITWYTWQLAIARDAALLESKTAQRTTDFLIDTFRAGDPHNAQGETITAVAVIDAGFERVQTELVDEPEVQARLYGTLSQVYSRMGRFNDAIKLARLALDYRTRNFAPGDREAIWLQQILAESLRNSGERAEAEAVALDGLKAHRAHRPPDERLLRELLLSIAVTRQVDGNIDGARDAYDQVLAILAAHGADNLEEELWIKLDYSHMLNLSGKSVEAEDLLAPVYPHARQQMGDSHPVVLSVATNLAHSYYVQQKFDDAVPIFEAVYVGRRKTLGDNHIDTLGALANLGSVQLAQGDATSGEERLRAAVAGMNETLGRSHANTILVTGMHSTSLTLLEKYDDAIEIQQATLSLARSELGDEHPYTLDLERFLVESYAAAGYLDKASAIADGVLQRHIELLGEEHAYTESIREIVREQLGSE